MRRAEVVWHVYERLSSPGLLLCVANVCFVWSHPAVGGGVVVAAPRTNMANVALIWCSFIEHEGSSCLLLALLCLGSLLSMHDLLPETSQPWTRVCLSPGLQAAGLSRGRTELGMSLLAPSA